MEAGFLPDVRDSTGAIYGMTLSSLSRANSNTASDESWFDWNLRWHPDSNAFTGGELLWGKRTDNDGESSKDLRFQYSFHRGFSSKTSGAYRL